MGSPLRVQGTLLCHAGPHRLAFHAHEVASIISPAELEAASARLAFRAPEGAARVLVSAAGGTVGVDTLEIDSETHPLLPPPPVLAGVSGGSLQGFVLARGELWPLVGLTGFERYLRGLMKEAA